MHIVVLQAANELALGGDIIATKVGNCCWVNRVRSALQAESGCWKVCAETGRKLTGARLFVQYRIASSSTCKVCSASCNWHAYALCTVS